MYINIYVSIYQSTYLSIHRSVNIEIYYTLYILIYTLHYITLHYITLHYITLHYILYNIISADPALAIAEAGRRLGPPLVWAFSVWPHIAMHVEQQQLRTASAMAFSMHCPTFQALELWWGPWHRKVFSYGFRPWWMEAVSKPPVQEGQNFFPYFLDLPFGRPEKHQTLQMCQTLQTLQASRDSGLQSFQRLSQPLLCTQHIANEAISIEQTTGPRGPQRFFCLLDVTFGKPETRQTFQTLQNLACFRAPKLSKTFTALAKHSTIAKEASVSEQTTGPRGPKLFFLLSRRAVW